DPVGEWSAHCQPPGFYIGRTKGESKRVGRVVPATFLPPLCYFPAMIPSPESAWSLHPQLVADTHSVGDLPLSRVLIIKDANFPWIILVPRRDGVSEILDLAAAEQAQLMEEISRAGTALKAITDCHKLNIAALGNVVPQLH